MGMLDYVLWNGFRYQSRTTPAQFLYEYKIQADIETGLVSLWVEEHDSNPLLDYDKINPRWVLCEDFTGEVRFHRSLDKSHTKWEEYSAYFVKGRLREINRLDDNENMG